MLSKWFEYPPTCVLSSVQSLPVPSSTPHPPTHQLLPERLFWKTSRAVPRTQKMDGLIPPPPCHSITFPLGGKHSATAHPTQEGEICSQKSLGQEADADPRRGCRLEITPPPQVPQPLAREWHFQMQEVLRVGCQATGFEKRLGSMHHHRLGVFHLPSQGSPVDHSK